ncbi:MAG: hypothetical protein NZ483_06825 [Verrucomicrobiae bacterium]|nr:hypothetical protein [Verrucomicrobiae bacterium]MDW8344855.1 hypothetical protein [Verrucomicrobiae bacterium]
MRTFFSTPSRNNWLLILLLPAAALGADPVALGQRAWEQLRAGDLAAATATFQSMLTTNTDPLAQAGDLMARRWLTRLDREKVKTTLHAYYAQHLEYPATLPPNIQPPHDRWGIPWRYERTTTRFVRHLTNQTYRLESVRLGELSDLAAALRVAYGQRIQLQPTRRDGQTVTFTLPGRAQPIVLSVGASFDGVDLAAVTTNTVILTDGDHWKTLPLPPR